MAPIAIEGVLGAGKSSVMEILKHMTTITVKPEPVEKWESFLDRAYAEGKGHVALQARIMLDTCVQCPSEQIVERSPLMQPLTFIPAMFLKGDITTTEFEMLKELHAALLTWAPTGTIFLRCTKEESLRRIRKRARGCEAHIDDTYIDHLHTLYEQAFQKGKVPADTAIIDVTHLSPPQVAAACLEIIKQKGWINMS